MRSGNDARGISGDLDDTASLVGDIQDPARIQCDAGGGAQRLRQREGHCADKAGGRDLADGVVAGVSDVDRPRFVNSDA